MAQADSEEDRQRRKRAAIREYEILQSLNHPNILPVTEYKEHELGPALLFRYLDPSSIRFDHYLATQCHALTTEQRLKFLREIADAIRYAHRKRVVHRALSPQSILVMKDEGGGKRAELERSQDAMVVRESSPFDDPSDLYVQVFNWSAAPATSDEGLFRAAALIELWQRGYLEPVQAPPRPYDILAQQLVALILQERGIGRSQWFPRIESVPGFASMSAERVAELVDSITVKGILWSDGGILAFAPEGESIFGRRNFMDILSVFTSPPLFKVMSGQKELGDVHESPFYRRDDGPPVLVLAGRTWKTKHLDWERRIAYVEATDEKGRSRWLGDGEPEVLRMPVPHPRRRGFHLPLR